MIYSTTIKITLVLQFFFFVIASQLTLLLKNKISFQGLFNINKNLYNIYVLLLMWVLMALPVTTVFLIKFNLLVNVTFESIFTIILFIIINTLILLIYYNYYIYNVVSVSPAQRNIFLKCTKYNYINLKLSILLLMYVYWYLPLLIL